MIMLLTKIIKSVTYCGGAALIFSSSKLHAKDMVACHECHMKRLPKAKELPMYEKDDLIAEYDENTSLPLVSEISSLRKKISQYTAYINVFQEEAAHVYETGVAHTKSAFEYLKNEENKVPRILIIASGGLIGLFYARKGGIFRKIIYTSLGTGVIFTIFYPTVSKEYVQAGWKITKPQINDLLVKSGGYDTDKITEDINAKLEYVKSTMKFEGLMKKLNEAFYKNKDVASKVEETNKSTEIKEA